MISQLTGQLLPNSGTIHFAGQDITRLPAWRRSALGLARSFQITSLLLDFTAADNVALAAQAHDGHYFRFFGDARKDTVIGPGRVNFNTSIYKSFAMTERAHFELRVESFNTFNHTEFNGIDNGFNDGNFGQVTSAYDPRVLQLVGKLSF